MKNNNLHSKFFVTIALRETNASFYIADTRDAAENDAEYIKRCVQYKKDMNSEALQQAQRWCARAFKVKFNIVSAQFCENLLDIEIEFL